jgi:nucleotide-binding universal stress UspA family protein
MVMPWSVRYRRVWAASHDVGEIIPAGYDIGEQAAKADRLLDEALTGSLDQYPDLRIHRHVVHDIDPVRAILAESIDAGLIVVGSRGLGGFAGLLLGSTVDSLVRQARALRSLSSTQSQSATDLGKPSRSSRPPPCRPTRSGPSTLPRGAIHGEA